MIYATMQWNLFSLFVYTYIFVYLISSIHSNDFLYCYISQITEMRSIHLLLLLLAECEKELRKIELGEEAEQEVILIEDFECQSFQYFNSQRMLFCKQLLKFYFLTTFKNLKI